jgi:hypothetical protein
MPSKYSSTIVVDKSVISIFEVSEAGLQRTFKVSSNNDELGNVTLDSWRVPSLSLAISAIYLWGGTRAFRLRADRTPELFTFDEEISALYPSSDNLILVCELSIRLLANDFRELDRYKSDEVLNAGWWAGDILHVSSESKQIDLRIESGQLKLM